MTIKKNLTLIFTVSAALCFGQKILLKGSAILVDKKPVGKLEGKATLFNGTNLTIRSLNDEPLITIKEKITRYKSHFQEGTRFTNISFPQSGKTFSRTDIWKYTSEKKIISWLFEKSGKDFLTEAGLNNRLVESVVTSHDESKKIHNDTIRIAKLISGYLESLKDPVAPRNLESKIRFKPLTQNEFTWEGYEMSSYATRTHWEVYQDHVLIGALIKLQIKESSNSDADFTKCEYYLLRKVQPFDIDGQRYDYAPLARLRTYRPGGLQTSITVEGQGMRSAPEISDYRNAEGTLVYTLIKEGLL